MSAIDKVKLDLIEDNAQKNIIESISVNGDEVEVINKNVNIEVPNIAETCDEKTISGNLIHIEDAVASSANIKINFSPIQNLNGYDHPWADGCGKNIINQNLYITNDSHTILTLGQAVGYGTPSIPMKAGTYTYSAVYKNGAESRGYMRKDGDSSNTKLWEIGDNYATFTLAEDILCAFWLYNPDGIEHEDVDVQIESGSAATSYEPYSNICPISGYTGVTVTRTRKNMLPLLASSAVSGGITYIVNSDGTVHATGTSTAANSATLNIGHCVLPPGDYVLSGCPAGGASTLYRIRLGSGSYTGSVVAQEFGDGAAFTLTQETDVYARFYVAPAAGAIDFIIRPMIRLASDIDVTFEPYNGATYLVTLPTEAGTVYGGMLAINTDGTGTLNVTKSAIATFDGTENWTVSAGAHPSYRAPRGTIPANAKGLSCNMLSMTDSQYAVSGYGYIGTTNVVCYSNSASVDNLEAWKAYLAETPMQIIYTLTEPITYDLTPLQVIKLFNGENNIWTDTNSDIDLTYKTRFTIITPEERNKLNNIPANAVPNYFGVCSDSDVTRTVAVDSSFTLVEGAMVNVFFESASTSQATLNVNNTGAYPIYIYGSQAVSNAIAWGWRDNQLVELVFYDSKWWVQNQYFSNAGTGGSGLMTTTHVTKLNSLDPNSTTQIVLTNENLDDIHPTATTWYVAAGGNSVTGKPGTWVTSFGMVCFRTAGGYIIQKLWPTSWDFPYSRTWSGTAWSAWMYEGRTATANETGLMSTTDKTNLDSIVGTQLTNEDLNNIHPDHFAIYYADGTNTCAHKPTGTTVTAFGMICIKVAYQYVLQIVFPHTANRTFTRYYNGTSSAWSGWRDQSITYTAASGWQGLMSAADKVKLDGLKASTINVTDTYGVCGTTGATVTIQALMDAIASKV